MTVARAPALGRPSEAASAQSWKPPEWAKAPDEGAPRMVLTFFPPGQSCASGAKPHVSREVSTKASYQLGRELADIPLHAKSASRVHAMVIHDKDGKTYVVDLRSLNGTYLHRHRLEPFEPYPWQEDDVFLFGAEDDQEGWQEVRLEAAAKVKPSKTESTSAITTPQAKSGQLYFDKLRASGEKRPREEDRAGPLSASAQGAAALKKLKVSATVALPVRPQADVYAKVAASQGCMPKTASASSTKPASPPAKAKTCDKCDGPHDTEKCPHFKKARETHKDAWVNKGRQAPLQMGKDNGNFVLRNARFVPQPGDGSCLFHSLCFGLNQGRHAADRLRKELAAFVKANPNLEIAGDTMAEWVHWDSGKSCASYASTMAAGRRWGGGIEMAACSHLKKVNVHVYEKNRRAGGFKRISCFDYPQARKTIHVLYQGGIHYDALVPSN
eukprot:TRINITY_DN3099_c0_g1_i1.p1 TRINITY_DN3099_c0_g1~~TRINITY_DN3099_c0_g1_i1.p1  ORF type:complete len:469 (+),score=85.81 TRINITY_DN3099_c0_g1_i1:82-1407(+)